ncbi:DUF58 domain-containing protein [bacterium]|nr:DUF58 domain-containing protein [bacterium]
MPNPLHTLDPDQLLQITDLQILARTVVEGFLTGIHKSPYTGASIEFAQYRPYVQGDDPRFIDWSLYARTDRLRTKQFQKETNLRSTILLDCSASMNYTSGNITKFHYARVLAACLAMLLIQQNDETGLITFHESVDTFIPPRTHAKHLSRILVALNNAEVQGQTDVVTALKFIGDFFTHRGMIILISDFLSPLDTILPYIKQLRTQQHDLLLLQIADPAEQTFDFKKSATFIDTESQKELFVVPDYAREEYLANRHRHFEALHRECATFEIAMDEFTITQPFDRALHFFLQQRNRLLTSTGVRRSSSTGGR